MNDDEFERFAGIRRTFKAPLKIEDMLDYMEASIKMDGSKKIKFMPCLKSMANRKFTVDKQFIHGFSALAHDEKINEYADIVQFLNVALNQKRVEMPEVPPPDVHTFNAFFQQPSMVVLKKWVNESISVNRISAMIQGDTESFDLHQYFVRRSGNKKPSFVLEAFRDGIKKSARIGFEDEGTFSSCERIVRALACKAHREVLMEDLRGTVDLRMSSNPLAGSLMPGQVTTTTVRTSQMPIPMPVGSMVQGSMVGVHPAGSMIRSSTVPAQMSRVIMDHPPPPSASRLLMQNQSQVRNYTPPGLPRTSVVNQQMPPPIPPPQVANAVMGSMARPGMGGSIINQLNVSRLPNQNPAMLIHAHDTPDKIPMPPPGQPPIPPGQVSSALLNMAKQSHIQPPPFQPAPFQPPPMKQPLTQPPPPPPPRSAPPPPKQAALQRKQSLVVALNHLDSLPMRNSKLNSSKLNRTIVNELLDPESEEDVMNKIQTQNNIMETPNCRAPEEEVEEIRMKKDYDIFHCIVPEFDLEQLFNMTGYRMVKEGPGYSIHECEANRKNMKLLMRLEHPRELALAALVDPSNYRFWNEQVELGNIKLRIYSENSVIAYQKHRAFNQFYRQRDFLYVRHVFKKDNIIYMVDKSIQHSNFPPFSYITRGDIKLALWAFKQQNPQLTTVTFMIETNFKGFMGGTKVVELTMKYLEEMSKLDDYLRDMQPVPITTKVKDYFDVDWDISRNQQNKVEEEWRNKNRISALDTEMTKDIPEELYLTAFPEVGWYGGVEEMSFQKDSDHEWGKPSTPTLGFGNRGPPPTLSLGAPTLGPSRGQIQARDHFGEQLQQEVGRKLGRKDTVDQHFATTMGNLLSRPDADVPPPTMMHGPPPAMTDSKGSLTSKLHNELINAYSNSHIRYNTTKGNTSNISAEIARAQAQKASEIKAHLNLEQAALRNRQLQQYDFINGKPVKPIKQPKKQLPPIPINPATDILPPSMMHQMQQHPNPSTPPIPPPSSSSFAPPPGPPPNLQNSVAKGLIPGAPPSQLYMPHSMGMNPPPMGAPFPPSSIPIPPPQMPGRPPATQVDSQFRPTPETMAPPIQTSQLRMSQHPAFKELPFTPQVMHVDPKTLPQINQVYPQQQQSRMSQMQQHPPNLMAPPQQQQYHPQQNQQQHHQQHHQRNPNKPLSHQNPPTQPFINPTARMVAQGKGPDSTPSTMGTYSQPSVNSSQMPRPQQPPMVRQQPPPMKPQQQPPSLVKHQPQLSSKNQLIPPQHSKKKIYTSDEQERAEITKPDQKHIYVEVPVQLNPVTGLCVLPQDYIRVRHQMKPLPSAYTKLANPKWRNYYLRDLWEINSTGELKCVNQAVLKEQHGVMSYVLSKFAKNLLTGKSILNISLPVSIFSEMSVLELTAKGFGFAPLFLQKAAKQSNPLQRFKLTMAFSIGYSLLYLQMQKPFNPILGETFQGWLNGCPVVCQQISHHPAITAFYMVGRGYRIYGNVEAKIDLSMNSGVGSNDGEYVIEFDNWPRNKIRMRSPGGEIQGLSYGERKFLLTGKSYYYQDVDGFFCQLIWNPYKKGLLSFGKQTKPSDTMEGPIVKTSPDFIRKFRGMQKKQGPGKKQILQTVGNVSGRWTQALKIDGVQYLNTTRDQPCLLEQQKYPLNSNCNYREDVIYRRKRDIARAQVEKERLEVAQRQDKKLRERRPGYKAH